MAVMTESPKEEKVDQFEIVGGAKLKGSVVISGSKNAALPCLFATLLTDEECVLDQVPDLADIGTSIKLLETLGKKVKRQGARLVISKGQSLTGVAPYELVRRMRASVLVMGPLLARRKKAEVSMPGGCAIGARPVNYHIDGFERMGVTVRIHEGYVDCKTKGLIGALIPLPYPSVGATENLLMGAALAKGTTIIQNAAREPEVVDLGHMLQKMGASIQGLETSEIVIQGVKKLAGVTHRVIPDRIEAGTFLIAAAACKGDIIIENINLSHLEKVVQPLQKAGLLIEKKGEFVHAKWLKPLKSLGVQTDVYPAFPTDMQAQWMALMSITKGNCVVKETVFENRFLHVQELLRFGADIQLEGKNAKIRGVDHLSGCSCMVSDLRAGAALVIAGLAAKGKTTVLRVYHLDRGYERLEKKLEKLGARIKRVNKPA
ncbi:MAG: UDP-N-acetylglucosamine 1-carboxyvinyltransferase [Elusimicrobia bacterium]|nr:UDP-N-acetylglucosamine 1-carboxyvinyltransferase [Elusimicrobiota bacterium]